MGLNHLLLLTYLDNFLHCGILGSSDIMQYLIIFKIEQEEEREPPINERMERKQTKPDLFPFPNTRTVMSQR